MKNERNISDYDQLIVEYLEGSISKTDQRALEKWVGESSANRELYYQSVEVWLAAQASLGANRDNGAEYKRFRQRMKRRSLGLVVRRTMRYAAAMVAGVAVTSAIFMQHIDSQRMIAEDRTQSINLSEGSKSHMYLADGSEVWLNSGSSLSYNGLFSSENREVTISGEGYFDVAKDSERPFIVNAGEVKVRVHGTKFNVRSYSKDDFINVSLKEGSVSLTTEGNSAPLFIVPSQMCSYDKSSGDVVISHINVQGIGSWIKDGLFFNELSLLEITKVLERRYGVKFIFQNRARESLEFYADFDEQLSIESILEVLAKGKRFSYERVGDTVSIY